jgi:hypothetical protein
MRSPFGDGEMRWVPLPAVVPWRANKWRDKPAPIDASSGCGVSCGEVAHLRVTHNARPHSSVGLTPADALFRGLEP